MPSNRRVRLTPDADEDFSAILEYTLSRWNMQQMDDYAAEIYEALGHLADFPDLGRTRDELSPGLRSYPVGDHVIFYRATSTELIVRRIMHSRRRLGRDSLR